MNKFLLTTAMILLSAGSSAAQDATSQVFQDKAFDDFETQDIDANVKLLEALTKAAKKGPKFRISPDKIFISLTAGEIANETIRISNVGDENGDINGINGLGSVEGIDITDNCPEYLAPGGFCDIAVRFESTGPTNIQTVVVITMQERGRTSFDIPVQIIVEAPIVAPEPVVEEEIKAPEVIIVPEIKAPVKPTASEIASQYFGSIGGRYHTSYNSGMIIVSKPESLNESKLLGIPYNQISSFHEYSDQRYGESVPSVDASLPVNRDKILTSDRVIKAVLDTPVSNIMCGKVVAIVESDVYSATGREPLIPAGSKAIGECGNFAAERVGISWSRIITTDGRSISFDDGSSTTNDASGLGGGLGRVYRSNFDRFVLPIFSTLIDTTAGVIFATFGEDETVVTQSDGTVIQSTSPANEGLRLVTEGARGTSQELIAEIRDIREVMVLPSGSRIDIELTDDVYFNDSREVVRIGDMTYRLNDYDTPVVDVVSPAEMDLTPYQPGMAGPVVLLNGVKYVLSEKPIIMDEDGEPVVNEKISDLSPEESDADR